MTKLALSKIVRAGAVVRYHTNLGPMQQTTGQHAWGVAVILTKFHPDPSAKLLKAALLHDAHEVLTGDTPFHARGEFPKFGEELLHAELQAAQTMDTLVELEDDDEQWLQWADRLEALLWSSHLADEFGFPAYRRIAHKVAELMGKISAPPGMDPKAEAWLKKFYIREINKK